MEETSEILRDSSGRILADVYVSRKILGKGSLSLSFEEGDRKRELLDCLFQTDEANCVRTVEIEPEGKILEEDTEGVRILIKEVTKRMLVCGVEQRYMPRFILWRGSLHLVSPKGELVLIDWFSNWTKDESFYRIIDETLEWQDTDLSHNTTVDEVQPEEKQTKSRALRMPTLLNHGRS